MTFLKKTSSFMEEALIEAKKAQSQGEVPVGAVIVYNNEIIARSGNAMRTTNDPTAHAEILVIRKAAQTLHNERLTDCRLYVTLEPCAMCAGAISLARIKALYYAAPDPKGGAVTHGSCFFYQKTCFHRPELYPGLCEEEAKLLLQSFFKQRRDLLDV